MSFFTNTSRTTRPSTVDRNCGFHGKFKVTDKNVSILFIDSKKNGPENLSSVPK